MISSKKKFALALLALACLSVGVAKAQDKEKTVYMAANAHLDTQWLWTVQQVIGEFLPNTLYQNLELLEKYPNYRFSFEGAVKYKWFKEYYPEQFEQVKKYVKEGRWYPAGGWDANDYNVPSTESNIKNLLLGQEFYKKEFGVKSIDIMLPDCFGFGYTMPTVLLHCGGYAFHTQKLQWREKPFYSTGLKWPFDFGIWKGVDGSEILASLNSADYGFNPRGLINEDQALLAKVNASPSGATMRYYGTKSYQQNGDKGGSPIPQGVRYIQESIDAGSSMYKLRFATVADIFREHKDLLDNHSSILPVFDGELLMDVHGTGVYTANSDNKKLNRRNEQLGYDAEALSTIADWMGAVAYPKDVINDAYQRFIWHQFHDDLTGTSIREAYVNSWNDLWISQRQFTGTMVSAVEGISTALDTRGAKGTPVVVFNPVGVKNSDIVIVNVDLPAGFNGVDIYGPDGKKAKSQVVSRDGQKLTVAFAASNPSVSLSVYDVRFSRAASQGGSSALKASGKTIENKIYKLTVGDTGDITSIIDKRNGKELVAQGEAFGLQVFTENTSNSWPAWEILKSVIDKTPEKVKDNVKVSVECVGPLFAVLKVERSFEDSKFIQRITLYDGAEDDRIDVRCNIDWNSRRTLLKTAFPVSFSAPEATYDLGIGNIRRGNNTDIAYEVCAQEWADMTAPDGSYGVSFFTDSRYGWDKPSDNTLRLTLLHTPTADRSNRQEKLLDIGPKEFTYSIVAHVGKLDAAATTAKADILNFRKSAYATTKHAGNLGKTFSMVSSSNPAIAIKALKKAEDGDGYILRVYELSGSDNTGKIHFASAITSAEQNSGIEEKTGGATFAGNDLNVDINRFGIRTYRVKLAASNAKVSKPTLQTVELPYNKVAISSKSFAAFGHMDRNWKSYAGDVTPEVITYKGVSFKTGEPDYDNAVECNGQTIDLPAGTKGVYLLLASNVDEEVKASFKAGASTEVNVPYWTGNVAGGNYLPWTAFYKEGDVAFVGSHRHDSKVRDEHYMQTYMFFEYIPVTGGATTLELPKNQNVIVLAATASLSDKNTTTEISDSITRIEPATGEANE